ncbi:hypothetical protein FACS1894191_7910 [Clostridia bacterium]|nr:hypothetical protein FACS1894191_7910 [Clostridia bacterium]
MPYIDDDDDMKIADGAVSRKRHEDGADAAARQFLTQKSSGNIDKARRLGGDYARTILDIGSHPELVSRESTMLETHHQLLLCAYIVNRVIAGLSPDSILAQTSLGSFYADVAAIAPHVYSHISDMAAFSLYILNERTGNPDEEIGKIYARLSGFEGDQTKIDDGNRIYARFHAFCADMMDKAGYAAVE